MTTAVAKTFLRVDVSDDDTLIDTLVTSARKQFEADTSLALVNQTCTMTMDAAPSGGAAITLPVGPVSSVTSITSYAADDTSSTVSTSVYRVDTASVPARIVLKDGQSWPSGLRSENALTVVFVAGYGATSASAPESAILAIKLLVSHWYANRESVAVGVVSKEIELGYRALIAAHKVYL